jgi:DNA-binding transcriptional ArsR family regulator
MVKYSDAPLDRTFAALADPTRRALLARLAEEPDLSVSALAEPFAVSLPAIMKHLDVLSDAGLVARTKSGRTVTCRLNAAPMQDAIAWLNRYERFWSEALSRLSDFLEEEESFLEEKKSWPSTPPSNQASQSNGTSKRPPPKSSQRGPTRKK